MNLIDIRSQIEEEITWRSEEIRFLKNQLASVSSERKKKIYRKSLLMMLYSHYEGFCKITFQIYIHQINNEKITRKEANDYIATASLSEVFQYYENQDLKNQFFKSKLPNDEKLHRYSRQVDFIKAVEDLWNQDLIIPEEIVDTESNLKPVVLKKILFRLGFEYENVLEFEGEVHRLLNFRNNIAHGSRKEGIDQKSYEDLEKITFSIMESIKKMVMIALTKKNYLR